MVVIKCRIIAEPREGTRHIYRKKMMTRTAYLVLLYEENQVGDLNTFAVAVVTFLRIMFLEKKYLAELYSSVQIVIITMRLNVEARLLWYYDISVSYSHDGLYRKTFELADTWICSVFCRFMFD
jgi:hypothetical protein